MINDGIAGDPILFSTCERCQSGSAFVSEIDDPHHRDARHGREEYFCRPGMDPPLAKTITGRFDTRYPENEIVLGINIDAGIRAYPLLEMKREGGVFNDELGRLPIVVMCGPRPEQATMSAFWRVVDDGVLSFEPCEAQVRAAARDRETGSLWTIEGRAIAGPLKYRRLEPLRWQYVRWHAWVYPHPATELFLSKRTPAQYPDFPPVSQVETLREVLDALSTIDAEFTFSHVVQELALPHEATDGICVYNGTDRLNLYAFASAEAASDYVELQGAWFCMPFDTKLARKRARCLGRFVVESDPIDQYAEPTQVVHYPDNETSWSDLVSRASRPRSAGGTPATRRSAAEEKETGTFWHNDDAKRSQSLADGKVEGHFMSLIRYLKEHRYDVVECAFLPHSQIARRHG